jgi:hypothetical protein
VEDRVVGSRFSYVHAVGGIWLARRIAAEVEPRVCAKCGDSVTGDLRPDAANRGDRVARTRRARRYRATMNADGREHSLPAVSHI